LAIPSGCFGNRSFTNVLAQRVGPKVGLLVSKGHEQDLYDASAAATVVGKPGAG
jgi:hypothetical protein